MSKKHAHDLDSEQEPTAKSTTEKLNQELNAEPNVLSHPSYIELEEKLTIAEQKAHENWEKSVRAMAEVDNIRRRAERDVEHAHRFGVEKLIKELIPVLDSMEQALQAAIQANDQSMIEGIELTHKLMMDALTKFDVRKIDALNQPFNPNHHEAMAMLENDEVPANTVINVFQQGYVLGERVVRPARVVVSKAKA